MACIRGRCVDGRCHIGRDLDTATGDEMKIAQLEVSGFRGIRDRTEIWFPAGFAIIVGRNGAGKSTVCDAIEFALTGTITRHRSGSEKGENIDQYLWWRGADSPPKRYVSLTLVDEGGREYVITRRSDGK